MTSTGEMSLVRTLQDELVHELGAIRQRGLHNINEYVGKVGRSSLPKIERLAYEYTGVSPRANRLEPIRALLRDALEEVREEDGAHYRELLQRVYGFHKDVEGVTSAGELFHLAATRLGCSHKTLQIEGRKARKAYASAILRLLKRTRAARRAGRSIVTLGQLLEGQPDNVRRDEYHERIDELLARNKKVVILNGERGNGKSRLALEFVLEQEPNDEDFIYISAQSVSSAARDIKANLAARGIRAVGSSIIEIASAFSELICTPDAPAWAVIDNIEDRDLLDKMLPSGMRSTVIVTSSVELSSYRDSTVEVLPMSDKEAQCLVRQLLPRISHEEVRLVATWLYGRPLPTTQICGFLLAEGNMSVKQFLYDLLNDPAATLDAPAPAVERTLTALYKETLRRLGARDVTACAASLLELVAFVAPEDIHRQLLHAAMATGPGGAPSASEFQRAVLELESRFLVRRVGDRLAIHPLTQWLLRAMLHDRELEICLSLYRPIQVELATLPVDTVIPRQVLELMPHARGVIFGLEGIGKDQREEIQLDHTLALLIRGLRQTGDEVGTIGALLLLGNITDMFDSTELKAMKESHIEWVHFMHTAGHVSTQEYMDRVEDFFRSSLAGDKEWLSRLGISDFLIYVTALSNLGGFNRAFQAFSVLAEQQSRFAPSSPDAEATPGQYGEYLAIAGELLIAMGEWPTAAHMLESSHYYFMHEEPDRHYATRGIIRALAGLVEVYIGGAQTKEHFLSVLKSLNDCANQKPEGFRDALSAARFVSVKGRVFVHFLLHQFCMAVSNTGSWSPNEEPIPRLRKESLEHLEAAYSLYRSAGFIREAEEIQSRALLVRIICFDMAVGDVMQHIESGNIEFHSTNNALPHFLIMISKVLFFLPEFYSYEEPSSEHLVLGEVATPFNVDIQIDQFKNIAFYAAYVEESLYWYCEALVLACAYSAIGGRPFQPLLNALQDGYDMIKRLDRWEQFRKALDALPRAYGAFLTEFSHLVIW